MWWISPHIGIQRPVNEGNRVKGSSLHKYSLEVGSMEDQVQLEIHR